MTESGTRGKMLTIGNKSADRSHDPGILSEGKYHAVHPKVEGALQAKYLTEA